MENNTCSYLIVIVDLFSTNRASLQDDWIFDMERNKLCIYCHYHFENIMCREIGKIATGGSKRGICVSTVREAEFYADDGFDDIVFAALFSADKITRYVWITNLL